MNEILLIILPFLGTTLGAMLALFIKSNSKKLLSALYGFSAGIMISASVWSLIIPSIEANKQSPTWLLPTLSCVLGVLLMLVVDNASDKLQNDGKGYNKVVFAISLHNFPEGLAVGIAVSAFLKGELSFALAFALSLGVAIQNIPEGAIVSMPKLAMGAKNGQALGLGVLSGIIELLGCLFALVATSFASGLLPFLLAFSAGTMLWVSFRELLPKAGENIGALACSIGFILMMALDVGLG